MLVKIISKIFLPILCFILLSTNVRADNDAQKEKAQSAIKNIIGQKIREMMNGNNEDSWLKRTEIELDLSTEGKPEYDILTVQPLFQSSELAHTIFTQGRIAYGNDGRTTTNIGLGYRHLTLNDKLLLGLNSFHDYEWPYNHQRVGFGFEIKSSAFEINNNFYRATSDWHRAGSGFEERALNGSDFEIGSQLPYMPWAYVFFKKFYWDGTADNNINGQTYSMRLRPTPFLEIEAGRTDDNRTESSEFIQVRARINWGKNHSITNTALIDDRAFRFNEDMKDQTLEKVRRENTIRVERKSAGATATISMARGT